MSSITKKVLFWASVAVILNRPSESVLARMPQFQKSEDGDDPVLIIDGHQDLSSSLGVQIVVSFFLLVAYFDFIFQTILFLYVFLRLIVSSSKLSEFLFALVGISVYLLLRATFIPFLIRPIPWGWSPTVPAILVEIPLYINMSMFVIFYSIAALACLYYVFFVGVTGKKLPGSIIDLKTGLEPMVVVLMPIYNEESGKKIAISQTVSLIKKYA
jgi:hypothetical protein